MREELEKMTKDQLIELVTMYSKDTVAMDGVWFQAIERERGMDVAMHYDEVVWQNYSVSEGRRLKKFLGLDEHPGLDGLEACFRIRYSTFANPSVEILREDDALIYRIIDCRVQRARQRKGMEFHPCKDAAVHEFDGFVSAIDDRIKWECLSCYPEITDESTCCAWRFTISE